MSRASRLLVLPLAASLVVAAYAHAYPKPSPYPTTWEFKHEVGTPKRFIVDGKAYWYLTYSVVNNTGAERVFLPAFEVLTPDGKVARTDRLIPLKVINEAKHQAGGKFLEQANEIAGEFRLGEDQARDGVAVWPETTPDDREFSVFFTGFSGETAKVPGPEGKELTLFKTLELNYAIPGDSKFRQINEIREVGRRYVMR